MLYTPMLPEAASGTLEPRHVVVPLRMMCPHAELLLGRATELDSNRRRVQVETERRAHDCRVRRTRRRARRRVEDIADSRPRRLRPWLQDACRRDPLAQPRPAPARGGRRCTERRTAAPRADVRLRRRGLRGRRSAGRARRPRSRRPALLPDTPRHRAALGARRRCAEDPPGDPRAPWRICDEAIAPTRRRHPCRDDTHGGGATCSRSLGR